MPAVPYLTGDRGDPHFEDPLLGFNFSLELEGAMAGYFTECSGIGSETAGLTMILPLRPTWTSTSPERPVLV